MKVIIAGSRDFSDYKCLERHLEKVQDKYGWNITEIVSGTARGADQLGERWAKEHGIPIKRFPADWTNYGKSAGYRRNVQMAEYADALIAFNLNNSKGTNHMINIAKERKLKGYVVRINDPQF